LARLEPNAPANRDRRLVSTVVAAAVAGLLALGAVLLLPSAVPEGLSLGRVDVDELFGRELVSDAHRYERFLLVDWVLSQIALIAVLWIYARRGAAFTRESAAGPIGTGMLLGMLGLAIVWLVRLPFRLVAHWWDRRHDISDLDYVSWLFEDWAVLAAEFLSICLALLIVMAFARWLGEYWWLPGAAAFVAIAAFFSFVAPYLYYGTKPLRDEPLVSAARSYERQQGLPRIPLRVEEVSTYTDQANAFAFGIGPSRRVVLWDTLLAEPFTEGEQKVVIAHELGHHSSEHIPKGLAWFAIFALPGAWILMRATRGRGGIGVPEAVPLALLVVALTQLAAAPAQNWISRRMEAEADWKALQSTQDPASLEKLMVDFSSASLGDPSPPTWAYVLLSTHPTHEQRVAMARAWAVRSNP
jgi:STE24 endopeptidase